jgi:hypothetical protein
MTTPLGFAAEGRLRSVIGLCYGAQNMANTKNAPQLIRTSILVPAETDRALRELADKGKRPLSWEVRAALEAWVAERKAA